MNATIEGQRKPIRVARLYEYLAREDPGQFRRLDFGTMSTVFAVQDRVVVKTNPHPEASKRLGKEATVYDLLRDRIPVPAVVGGDLTAEVTDHPVLVVEKLPGEPVVQDLNNRAWPERRNNLVLNMGAILGKLHALPAEEAVAALAEPPFGGYPSHDAHLRARFGEAFQKVTENGLIEDETVARLDKYVRDHTQQPDESKPSLLHGNYNYTNVIGEEGHVTGVVDWEHASIGSPLEELAVVLYRTIPKTPQAIGGFEMGYQQHSPISPLLNERRLVYPLLYYLKFLPEIPTWQDQPDKQRRYTEATAKIIREVIG